VSAPVVRVAGLALDGPEGPVFGPVDATVWPGMLTAVVGPAGSGRSALLLALTGRMRGCTGTVLLADAERPHRGDARRLRSRSAVARLGGLVAPEDRLDVAQSLAERALIDGVRPDAAEQAFTAAEQALDVHLDRRSLVEQLGAYEQAVLAVALARVRPADLVVLDDADADLDLEHQRRLLEALARLAATGPAVLVSTSERAALAPGTPVVGLAAAPTPNRSEQKAS
jgi:ABC-2 type transport system ATP-binding protein